MGLYFKFSIVLFYIPIVLIYIIIKNIKFSKKKFNFLNPKRYLKYIKLILKKKNIILIILISIISNSIVIFQNNKYDLLYKDCDEIEGVAIVIGNKIEKQYNYVYKIKVIEINNSSKYKDTYLNLRISKNKKIKLEYGDKISIKGKFIEPEVSRNYKGFNYKEYLKILKVYGTVNVNDVNIISKEKANMVFMISNRISLAIEKKIDNLLNKEKSAIVKGILLGDKSDIGEEVQESFKISRNITYISCIRNACISYNNANKYML